MRDERLEREILTAVERRVLNEIVRPAITQSEHGFHLGTFTRAETLNFVHLLTGIKRFYKTHCTQQDGWDIVVRESNL